MIKEIKAYSSRSEGRDWWLHEINLLADCKTLPDFVLQMFCQLYSISRVRKVNYKFYGIVFEPFY